MSQRSSAVVGLYVVGAVQILLLMLILLRVPASPPMHETGPRVDLDLTPVLEALEELDRNPHTGDRSAPNRASIEDSEPRHDELLEAIDQLRERLSRDVAALEVASGRFASDVSETAKRFPTTNGTAVKEFAQFYERDEDAAQSSLALRTMPEILTRFGAPTDVIPGIRFEYYVEITGTKYTLDLTFTNGLVSKVFARVRDR